MIKESLDPTCSPYSGELKVENFETIFYVVRYMWAPGNIEIG